MNSQRVLLHRFKQLQLQRCNKLTNFPELDQDPVNLNIDLSQLCRLIECPVCREVPEPPIHNCVNGHFVCGRCRLQLTTQQCAYCLGGFTGMRNYPLESLVSTPFISCDFVQWGCTHGKLTLQEYETHVQQCWAQIWRPGQIKPHRPISHSSGDPCELATCPKCQQENSTRKVKCRKCDGSLRPPTPLKI